LPCDRSRRLDRTHHHNLGARPWCTAYETEANVIEEVRAAAEVARLYPAVYRRYHVSRRALPDSDVTPRLLGAPQHLAAAGPLTVGEAAAHLEPRPPSWWIAWARACATTATTGGSSCG